MHKLLHSFPLKREHVRLRSVTVWRYTSTSWPARCGHWGCTWTRSVHRLGWCCGRGQWDIPRVNTSRLTPGGATARLLMWSMWRCPRSAVILPATHVGPAAKFRTNTESPSVNCLSWLVLSWPAFWRAWALVTREATLGRIKSRRVCRRRPINSWAGGTPVVEWGVVR